MPRPETRRPEIGVLTGWLTRLGREAPADHAHLTGYGMPAWRR